MTKLFDLLESFPVYDQAVIKEKIDGQGLRATLSTQVQRLRKNLRRSLRSLYADATIDAQIHALLEEAALLQDKQLTATAFSSLEQAAALARRYSRVHHALIIIGWKRRLLPELHPKGVEQAYEDLREEQRQLLQVQTIQLELQDLHARMTTLVRTVQRPQNAEEHAHYREIGLAPEVDQAMATQDFLSQVYARHIRGFYHFARQEYQTSYEIHVRIMEQWRSEKGRIEDQPDLFLTTFNSYQTVAMYALDDLKPLDDFLRYIREIPIHQPQLRFRLKRISYHKNLLLLLNTAQFEAGETLADEIILWMKKEEKAIGLTLRITLWYNLAILFFFYGKPSRANKLVNDILNAPGEEERRDIRSFARILQLILLDQAGELDLVDSLYRSIRRKFNRHSPPSQFHAIVLEAFSPASYRQTDRRASMNSLKEQLKELGNSDEAIPFGFEEVKMWAESEYRNKSLEYIFRERIGLVPTN